MSQFHPLTLLSRRAETARARVLDFSLPLEQAAAMRVEPGQHLVLRAVLDGVECRRTYSVCGHRPGVVSICVRSDGGGRMAGWLRDGLNPGEQVDALSPTGRFVLTPSAAPRRVLAIAAGIGITPILAIVRAALELSGDSQVTLLYGSRNTEDVLFAEELQALKDRYPARLALHFFMSREPQDVALYDGRINQVKLRELVSAGQPVTGIDAAYLCAPEALMQEMAQVLQDLGLPGARVHLEHFVVAAAGPVARTQNTAATAAPGATAPAAVPAGTASGMAAGRTRVSVRMDGRVRSFDMPREGEQPVLEAAEQAGLDLPFACKGGVCSTCRCHVTRGSVRMLLNYALEDAEVEAGYILTCQSIPTSAELELDYDKG